MDPPSKPTAAQLARARRSCGVCADDEDLFRTMRRELTAQAATEAAAPIATATKPTVVANREIAHAATPKAGAAAAVTAAPTAAAAVSTPVRPLPCPPDSAALGRGTWTLLHSMAAYYPDAPSTAQQSSMRSFIRNFAAFYPCPPCAEHLQKHVATAELPTQSRQALGLFWCNYHNDVNRRLRKPLFDCSRLDERWRDGPQLGAPYDCIEPTQPDDK